MRSSLTAGVAAAGAAAGLALFAPGGSAATADERICRGTLGAVTVDDLRVPQRAACTLNGTRMKGNVTVARGGTLRAYRIRVAGNMQAQGATRVNVTVSTIGGDIQLEQGRHAILHRDVVGGNVQLFSNRGTITITRNRVDGNLQCKSNNPRPKGHSNLVDGKKEDQCARL